MPWDDAVVGGGGGGGGVTGFGLVAKNQAGDDIGIWEITGPQNFGANTASFYFGSEGVSYRDAGFLNFRGLMIPAGATIVSARIAFKATHNKNAAVASRIYGNDVAAPPAVASAAQCEALALTDAYVDWTMEAWTAGEMYVSPDFAAVVQEIVDRQDWVEGGTIRILIKDNLSTDGNNRIAAGGGANAADGPVLSVSFTTE